MESLNKKFIGNWNLLEWSAELIDGTIVYPFGTDTIGRISYDSNGNMSVQIMKKDRQLFVSEDPLQAEPDEIVSAY
jgi:hypothetical protein